MIFMPPASPKPEVVPDDDLPEIIVSREQRRVRRWRIDEARRAGLTRMEQELFADGDTSTAILRKLRSKGATCDQIRRIVL